MSNEPNFGYLIKKVESSGVELVFLVRRPTGWHFSLASPDVEYTQSIHPDQVSELIYNFREAGYMQTSYLDSSAKTNLVVLSKGGTVKIV